MRSRAIALSLVGPLTFCALLLSAGKDSVRAHAASTTAQGLGGQMPPGFDQDVARVVADLDRIEADTLRPMDRTTLDRQGQIHTLGKLMLFDKHLSVNQNEACSFCHTPETGFTGPIQSLNLSTVSYPGSVRTRFSQRKPQSYMYATFAPVLHYNALQGDFVGGNFWDMRARGYRLQNPSAEQAQGPPTNGPAAPGRQGDAGIRGSRLRSAIPGSGSWYQGSAFRPDTRTESGDRGLRDCSGQTALPGRWHQRRTCSDGSYRRHRIRTEQRHYLRGSGGSGSYHITGESRRAVSHQRSHATDRAAKRLGGNDREYRWNGCCGCRLSACPGRRHLARVHRLGGCAERRQGCIAIKKPRRSLFGLSLTGGDGIAS